jgi:hypothetical protein
MKILMADKSSTTPQSTTKKTYMFILRIISKIIVCYFRKSLWFYSEFKCIFSHSKLYFILKRNLDKKGLKAVVTVNRVGIMFRFLEFSIFCGRLFKKSTVSFSPNSKFKICQSSIDLKRQNFKSRED